MAQRLQGSLTIRISAALERRLARTSKRRHRKPSELARELIEAGLDQDERTELPAAGELVGHLLGSISSKRVPAGRDAKRALGEAIRDRRR
ncbi:MAG: hypothetical protein AMXMBFR34_23670 [Myxococcaceae bacterium]